MPHTLDHHRYKTLAHTIHKSKNQPTQPQPQHHQENTHSPTHSAPNPQPNPWPSDPQTKPPSPEHTPPKPTALKPHHGPRTKPSTMGKLPTTAHHRGLHQEGPDNNHHPHPSTPNQPKDQPTGTTAPGAQHGCSLRHPTAHPPQATHHTHTRAATNHKAGKCSFNPS